MKKKIALIIGNTDYEVDPLRSCINDARDITNTLKSVGFDVTLGSNLTYKQMLVMIDQFTHKITHEDLVVFYFSGHGSQVNAQNYLIAIDNQCIVRQPSLHEKHAICAQTTHDSMMSRKPFAVIFLLDCCREAIKISAEAKAMRQRDDSMNFAPMRSHAGSLIVYACGPNQMALDNSPNKRNSLFTYHLLEYLAQPNLRVEEMMVHVSAGVEKNSNGKSQVHRSSSLSTLDVYVNFINEIDPIAVSKSMIPMTMKKSWLNLKFVDNIKKTIRKPNDLEIDIVSPPVHLPDQILSRVAGSMLAMAIGDALGAHVEYRPREYLLEYPVTDFGSGGTWGLVKGQFTDDTSMALCLANSLIACQGLNLYDQLVRYKWWYRHGYMSSTGECFDIGNATRDSIEEFERRQSIFAQEKNIPVDQIDDKHDPELFKSFNVQCSSDDVADNGSLMRLAPVPLFFYRDPPTAVEYSGRSGQITHGDRKVYDACRYYGALIVAALQGQDKATLLDNDFYRRNRSWFGKEELHRDIIQITRGSYKKSGGYNDGIRGSEYIVEALEAALWAFWSTDSFKEGALAAVNLGDDTDTTAAIYGQLAGAVYGLEHLPRNWLDQVYARKFLHITSQWLVYEGEQCHSKMTDNGTLLSQQGTYVSHPDDEKIVEEASALRIDAEKESENPPAESSSIETLNSTNSISYKEWINLSPEEIFGWLKSIGIRNQSCLYILQQRQIRTPQLVEMMLSSELRTIGITNTREHRLIQEKIMMLSDTWNREFYRRLSKKHLSPPNERIFLVKDHPDLRPLFSKSSEVENNIFTLITHWTGNLPEAVKISSIDLIYNQQRYETFRNQVLQVENQLNQRKQRSLRLARHLNPTAQQLSVERLKQLVQQVKYRGSVFIVRGWQWFTAEKMKSILTQGRHLPSDFRFSSSAFFAILTSDKSFDQDGCLLMSYIIVPDPLPYSLSRHGRSFRFICDCSQLNSDRKDLIPPIPTDVSFYPPAQSEYWDQQGWTDEFVTVNENHILDYAMVTVKPRKNPSSNPRGSVVAKF